MHDSSLRHATLFYYIYTRQHRPTYAAKLEPQHVVINIHKCLHIATYPQLEPIICFFRKIIILLSFPLFSLFDFSSI